MKRFTHQITIGLTADKYNEISEAANISGVTRTEYVRTIVEDSELPMPKLPPKIIAWVGNVPYAEVWREKSQT